MFSFTVTGAGHLPTAKVYYVEGALDAGLIRGGETARIEGSQYRRIVIKSVALIEGGTGRGNRFTLSIERPPFPVEELVGRTLTDLPGS
jgi:hypothetical protein